MNHQTSATIKRKSRVRGHLIAHLTRPRLIVHRTNLHIYAQIVDHVTGATLAAASDLKLKTKATKTDKATKVGQTLAAAAKAKKITQVTFDRGPYRYHGRVKAVADAARSAGLQF